jgi:hypothetical protein
MALLSAQASAEDLGTRVQHALAVARDHAELTVRMLGDSTTLPRSSTRTGRWLTVPADDWTSGFFPGLLWNLHSWFKTPALRHDAERFTALLSSQQNNSSTHDVGFMMFCSYGNGNRLYPSEAYRKILLQSARSLASRFDPRVGSIKSWDGITRWAYPVIIDNLVNLELLFWAAGNGGPAAYRDVATRHALATLANHVRPDGSTFHVVDYDTVTGDVVARQTAQGFSDGSVWARGQAWAVYGFTMVYRETRDERFLKTAQHTADYFVNHLPADGVPYWDFEAPDIPDASRDASAGAIAASALLELCTMGTDTVRQHRYRTAAELILGSLTSPAYLAQGPPAARGILNHATGNHPRGLEIDVSLIYGDYYFVEALLRYNRLTSAPPPRARSR